MSCEPFSDLLGAYRDGELSPEELRRLASHITGCSACAVRLDADAAVSRAIRMHGRPELPQSLSPRVLAALDAEDLVTRPGVTRLSAAPRLADGLWRQAAAVLFACALSAAAGWQSAQWSIAQGRMLDEVVAAHLRSLVQDNPLQVASSDSHTVRPWFAGRVEVAPNAQDFAAQGFPLVGGRLDMLDGHRVAVLVYKRRAHWVNVYVTAAGNAPDAAVLASTRNGYNVLSWTSGGLKAWAVSDLNLTELRQLQAKL